MFKRLMSVFLVTLMCTAVLSPLALAWAADGSTAKVDPQQGTAQVSVAGDAGSNVGALSAAEREAFRQAQQSSDQSLDDLRAGHAGAIIVLIFIFILIIAIID